MRKEALAIAKISIYHETHETSKNKKSWNYYSESTFFCWVLALMGLLLKKKSRNKFIGDQMLSQ